MWCNKLWIVEKRDATISAPKGEAMKAVGADDFFETRKMSSQFGSDEAMMIDCYLPMLGGNAFALREALLSLEEGELLTHEKILGKLRLTSGEFYNAMESLEALGLVRTFVKTDGKVTYFVYCLYAPLSPQEFFADPLFAGTLHKYIGDKEFSKLKKKYAAPSLPEGLEEATCSFISVFMPDFADPVYLNSRFNGKGHDTAKVRTSFDHRAFLTRLVELGIPQDALSSAEIDKVERVAALYRLSSETIAEFAAECIVLNNRKGQRLILEDLTRKASASLQFPYLHQEKGEKSQVSGKSPLAEKIRLMDSVSPAQFLSYLQNGHRPSSSDLYLVQRLSVEMGLPDGVINALVDYVLQRNDNILSASFTEKVAASLQRKGVRTARDAMECLNASKRKNKRPVYQEKPEEAPSETPVQPKPQENEVISDEEFDKMVASLYND